MAIQVVQGVRSPPQLSVLLQERTRAALRLLAQKIVKLDLPFNLAEGRLLIKGRVITVIDAKDNQYDLLFPSKKQSIVVRFNGKEESLEGEDIETIRKTINALIHHAMDMSVGSSSVASTKIKISPLPMNPRVIAISKKFISVVYPMSDTVGALRNLLDIVDILLAHFEVIGTADQMVFGRVIAGFRVLQGSMSLPLGIIKMIFAEQALKRAKEACDLDGQEIAKLQIASAACLIFEGILWIIIGSLVLAMPQLYTDPTMYFRVLQWILFYGGFTTDSIVSLLMARKMDQLINKKDQAFREGVLENNDMTLDEKNRAALQFVLRQLHITQIERQKNESQIEALQKKQMKKTASAGRLGITEELLSEILTHPEKALMEVEKALDYKRAEQTASRLLAIFCLVVNIAGVQLDLMSAFPCFSFGIPDYLIVANDSGWVLANEFYFGEDLPCNLVTKLVYTTNRKIKSLRSTSPFDNALQSHRLFHRDHLKLE